MSGGENEWEIAGRLRKARALVGAARDRSMSWEGLNSLDDDGWVGLAGAAGVRLPSDRTKRVALALMPKEGV